jgi:signal transduction histidine kinase
LSNACKFTEKGAIHVRVGNGHSGAAFKSGAGDRLTFQVNDTGIGMKPDQLQRIFCAFTQADSSISKRFGGTGLGLALSRKFVELMGGELVVKSAYGKGSSFTVVVPRSLKVSGS